jgi:Aerobic-type carbon monoxide dehydrogenase, large subunit CoxL/CutL homologs
MGQFGVGQAVRRKEDNRLLQGKGRYLDDISIENQAYGTVLRSPHAYAKINSINIENAKNLPGVIDILTSKDLKADGIKGIPCLVNIKSRDEIDMSNPLRPILADEYVRYVGDYVAFVIAESKEQAFAAIELIEVDYDVLQSVTNPLEASKNDSPKVWDDFESNRVFDWENGNNDKVEEIFKNADHTSTVELTNNRVVVNSMEPRGAIGEFDSDLNKYTLHTPSQNVHLMKTLVSGSLGIDQKDIRVVSPDMGGGFGMKVFVYPEQVLTPYASKKTNRTVK